MTERPFVFVEWAQFADLRFTPSGIGILTNISLHLNNTGKNPASISATHTGIFVGDSLPRYPKYFNLLPTGVSDAYIVPPNPQSIYLTTVNYQDPVTLPPPFGFNDLNDNIYIYGLLEYIDSYTDIHFTSAFCFVLDHQHRSKEDRAIAATHCGNGSYEFVRKGVPVPGIPIAQPSCKMTIIANDQNSEDSKTALSWTSGGANSIQILSGVPNGPLTNIGSYAERNGDIRVSTTLSDLVYVGRVFGDGGIGYCDTKSPLLDRKPAITPNPPKHRT